jgi:hypothetical protein
MRLPPKLLRDEEVCKPLAKLQPAKGRGVTVQAAVGWGLFLVGLGLGLGYRSRQVKWDAQNQTWENARGPGDTD